MFEDYAPTEAGDSDHDSDAADDDDHDDSENTDSEDDSGSDDADEAGDDRDQVEDEDAIEDSASKASSEQHGLVGDDGDGDEVNVDDSVSDNVTHEQDQVHDESAPLANYGSHASEAYAAGEESNDLQVSNNDGESLSSHQGDSEDTGLESTSNKLHPFAGAWSFLPLSASQSEPSSGTGDELGMAGDAI